jgi:dipeptidyl aminopeptidase/acylaminoacyl peptidase
MRVLVLAVLAAWLGFGFNTACAEVTHPPLEAYGDLPSIRYMALSPDGSIVAFAERREGADYLVTFDFATRQKTYHVKIDDVATRDIWFADEDNIVILASETKFVIGFRGEFEYSGAFSFNLKTKDLKFLLRGTDNIYPAQGGLGRIVGDDADPGYIFMPAYVGDRYSHPNYSLLRVNLKTGKGRRFKSGVDNTVDWFVDKDGTVLAREDYNNTTDTYRVYTYVNGKRELIYELETSQLPPGVTGIKADRSALLFSDGSDAEDSGNVYELDFSGQLTPASLGGKGGAIERIIKDGNRFVLGVEYSGAVPSYKFFDPDVDAAVSGMVNQFSTASVNLVSWTDDWSKLLYLIYGSDTPGSYVLQDRGTGQMMLVADERDNIPPDAVGQMVAVSYKARDGLNIPSILTWPAGVDIKAVSKLPLVVMPHGGPASYDAVGFDWMAQYFANRGYIVLQPNFRGSTGYGNEFEELGYGEWGLKMQDDVTDGVNMLVKEGLADPDRVCIVGASYGGYSALAGGAYTPDLYKCVVAIAPVTDLRRILSDERWDIGKNHWVLDYWHEVIGDPQAEREKLDAISPANAAENFTAPVMLIHGNDDTVVPIKQSEIMERALEQAGKDVTFIKLKGEDHWMSDGDTRIEALRAMTSFVDQHIGAEAE